jgi:hypothetical protein
MCNLPSKDDGSSSLNVIVEALVGIPITVQVVEGLFALEIFKLNDHLWVDFLGSFHELIHEVLLLTHGDALRAQSEVQRILQVCLIGSTAVQDNGEGLFWMNTGSSCVEG